jgi:hypothetical protein
VRPQARPAAGPPALPVMCTRLRMLLLGRWRETRPAALVWREKGAWMLLYSSSSSPGPDLEKTSPVSS